MLFVSGWYLYIAVGGIQFEDGAYIISNGFSSFNLCGFSFLSTVCKAGSSGIEYVRSRAVEATYKHLPSPDADLLLGMVLGVNTLNDNPKFKTDLRRTGTIHVVVVSGFNVGLVYSSLIGVLGSKYKKRNVLAANLATFIYSVLTGFNPPVVRSWVMLVLTSAGKLGGRAVGAFQALFSACILLLLLQPEMILDLSFQLSVLSTFGIILFQKPVREVINRVIKLDNFLIDDFCTTVSAQLLVTPLVCAYFGTISVVSFLVNPLVLWSVPISTMLGFGYEFVCMFSGGLVNTFLDIFSVIVYPFLHTFVRAVSFFADFEFSLLPLPLASKVLFIYYAVVLGVAFALNKRRKEVHA